MADLKNSLKAKDAATTPQMDSEDLPSEVNQASLPDVATKPFEDDDSEEYDSEEDADPDAIQKILSLLPFVGDKGFKPAAVYLPPYNMYRGNDGNIALDPFRTPYQLIQAKHFLQAFPIDDHFPDIDGAAVELGYSMHWAHMQIVGQNNEFCKVCHNATFAIVGSIVVAVVTFNDYRRLSGDEKMSISLCPGTLVEFNWLSSIYGNPQRAKGYVAPNFPNLPKANAHVILKNRTPRDMAGQAFEEDETIESDKDSATFKSIRNHKVKITLSENHQLYTRLCKTVKELRFSDDCQKFHEALLNHGGDRTRFDCTTTSSVAAENAARNAVSDTSNNRSSFGQGQIDILLDKLREIPCRIFVIEGANGPMMTTAQAVLARYLSKLGYRILHTSSSNKSVQKAAEAFNSLYGHQEGFYCLTVPSPGRERKPTRDKKYNNANAAIDSKLSKNPRTSPPASHNIQSQILQAFQNGSHPLLLNTNLQRVFPSLGENDRWKWDGKAENMLEVGQYYIDLNTNQPTVTLSDEQKLRFDMAMKFTKEAMIRNCPIICCTTQEATSEVIVKNFAKAPNARVVVIENESACETELLSWSPAVYFAEKCAFMVLAGDFWRISPRVDSSPRYNEFHERLKVSLGRRLLKYRCPHYQVREQQGKTEHEMEVKDGDQTKGHKGGHAFNT